jgi:zinc transport system ATP-binding protein
MNITVNDLSLEISGVKILHQISFQIPDKSFTCMIGSNGAGKSTLIKAITREITGYSGSISEIKENELSYLPQKLIAPAFITVFEVVHTGFYGVEMSKKEKVIATNKLLEQCGIEHVKDGTFSDVSAGEQQKTWLAFALAQSKDLIIMDEPLSSVDPPSRESFYEILRKISNNGKTLIVVTHDLDMAIKYSDKIICLNKGNKVFEGKPSAFPK